MTLKRDLVKYVRDKAKSKYKKGTECFICGSQENLDFHHFYGLTELLETWLRKNKITIENEADILALRERFMAENTQKSMRSSHLMSWYHLRLHSIYEQHS